MVDGLYGREVRLYLSCCVIAFLILLVDHKGSDTIHRRVSVLHGRPASIAPTEVDAELPKDSTGSGQLDQLSSIKNMSALIDMTLRLSDVANAM